MPETLAAYKNKILSYEVRIMMLYSDCGYFNEEKDDEYAPPYGECECCYRYDICRKAKTLEELLSGKMVKLNFTDLSKFISDFPDKINTLMIQKTFDGYCIIVDDISVRREQKPNDRPKCKHDWVYIGCDEYRCTKCGARSYT